MIAKVPDLPPEFTQTIRNAFGEDGKRWLDSFPTLLEAAARRWDLTDIRAVPNLSYNFVAFATGSPLTVSTPARCASPGRASSTRRPGPLSSTQGAPRRGEGNLVLKLGVPHRELTSEIAALRHYDGRGVCRLLDEDAEKGMLLLERLQPGHMLATLEDDDRATQIAAGVMQNLWKSGEDVDGLGTTGFVPAGFIQLKDWFDGFQRLRQWFDGGTGPLPARLVEAAETLSSELLAENKDEVLLHGDFHHYNVLESSRGWLAIDPKGVIGPHGYELGPFLFNPFERFLNEGNPRVRTARRVAILSEMLGLERERILAWGFCHAVLSAWWSVEGNEPGVVEYSLRCAEIFRQAGA